MVKNVDCKGFLIDGYPRDVPQGKQFEESVSFFPKSIFYIECLLAWIMLIYNYTHSNSKTQVQILEEKNFSMIVHLMISNYRELFIRSPDPLVQCSFQTTKLFLSKITFCLNDFPKI